MGSYVPSDIYSADEKGFLKMLPVETLDIKGQHCHRSRHSKRVTVLKYGWVR